MRLLTYWILFILFEFIFILTDIVSLSLVETFLFIPMILHENVSALSLFSFNKLSQGSLFFRCVSFVWFFVLNLTFLRLLILKEIILSCQLWKHTVLYKYYVQKIHAKDILGIFNHRGDFCWFIKKRRRFTSW